MGDHDYKQAFESARLEYEELCEQRQIIDARLTRLRQLVVSLSPLIGEDPPEIATGLMDAIRQVLRAAGGGLRPPEVRAHLKALGIELPKVGPLAAIHVTLKRLVDNEEVEQIKDTNGRKKYQWIGKSVTIQIPTGSLVLGSPPEVVQNASMDAANIAVQANYAARNRTYLHASGATGPPFPIREEIAKQQSKGKK